MLLTKRECRPLVWLEFIQDIRITQTYREPVHPPPTSQYPRLDSNVPSKRQSPSMLGYRLDVTTVNLWWHFQQHIRREFSEMTNN